MKKANKDHLQQGDVILHRVTDKVEFSKGKRLPFRFGRRLVLAEGEATGHHHSIAVEENEAELVQLGERLLLSLSEPKILEHQEHGPITVEEGIWEVGQVVEKDWLTGMVEKVVD